ncbi:MAG TPA: c-type cytochrome [Vicinamibacterales bacterium]|jgi:cytochrome c2|nr:cytochrome c [Acidobacteriota bacterium]HQX83690.1 c-type cytochrome [Vicinamibacterales bacterium]
MAKGRFVWVVMALALVSFVATPLAASGDKVKGAKVYQDAKCSVCHKIGTTGGKMGPDISKVGTTRNEDWLKKYLANPKAENPKNKMPPVKAKGEDLEHLIAYLLSLK